jgi:hypothetical protein
MVLWTILSAVRLDSRYVLELTLRNVYFAFTPVIRIADARL